MRHLIALALAPALLIACGASPEENSQSSAEAIVSCSAGYYLYCDTNETTGKLFCTCQPDVCSFSSTPPPGPPDVMDVIAWAVKTTGGSCPRITNANGTWADINDPLNSTGGGLHGVPNSTIINPAAACAQVPNMGSSCCTYVWWPSATTTNPDQDITGLCRVNGEAFVAIEGEQCVSTSSNRCGEPGNGGCSTCKQIPAP